MAVIDWLIPEHKAERAHTRNTAWSTNWQQFALTSLYSHILVALSVFPTDSLVVVTLSHFSCFLTDLPLFVPALFRLFQITIASLPLSLCCVIAFGIAKQGRSRPEVTIPLWLTSWSFISMVTQIVNHLSLCREISRLIKSIHLESHSHYSSHKSYPKPWLSTRTAH